MIYNVGTKSLAMEVVRSAVEGGAKKVTIICFNHHVRLDIDSKIDYSKFGDLEIATRKK